LKYLGIFCVCAVLCVITSGVCFSVDKEWLAKKKQVVVGADGSITAEYSYSFLVKHSAQGSVIVEVPQSNLETGISHVWGSIYCNGKEIIAETRKGSVTFSEYCPQQPFEYGFTVVTSSQGFDDLYADRFVLEKQFRTWSYDIWFSESRTVTWEIKGTQIIRTFPKEGQQKGHYFQWEMQANPLLSDDYGQLIVTTIPSWELVSRRYWLLWHKQCTSFQVPSEEALGITGKNDLEKVIALRHYFLKKVQYRELRRSQHFLQPVECREAWRSQEGDCKDLVLLFYSIVTRWGIRAKIVLQAGAEHMKVQNELPDPSLFDHALVLLSLDSGRYLFDPAMEKIRRYQDQDNHRLLHLSN